MPRLKRITSGGIAYHVLNRANGKQRIFHKDRDYEAFEEILADGIKRFDMRMCGYSLMSNHWHLVLWPRNDGDLSQFMKWVTVTHTQRWHAAHGTTGTGHVYQGRFKSFPIQRNSHYLTVLRYVESNPLRAGLVDSSKQWPWSSLSIRLGTIRNITLCKTPVTLPEKWLTHVDNIPEIKDIQDITRCIKRSCPYGGKRWIAQTTAELGLESTMRPLGRPKKGSDPFSALFC